MDDQDGTALPGGGATTLGGGTADRGRGRLNLTAVYLMWEGDALLEVVENVKRCS